MSTPGRFLFGGPLYTHYCDFIKGATAWNFCCTLVHIIIHIYIIIRPHVMKEYGTVTVANHVLVLLCKLVYCFNLVIIFNINL